MRERPMDEMDYAHKLDELDRLLNADDAPMEPERVWSLLAEISQRDIERSEQEAGGA
jgi:hypothetical protein